MSDDANSSEETAYLLQSPANSQRLVGAVADIRQGKNLVTKTVDDMDRLGEDSTDRAPCHRG